MNQERIMKKITYLLFILLEIVMLLLGGLLSFILQSNLVILFVAVLVAVLLVSTYLVSYFFRPNEKSSLYEALFSQNNDAVFLLDLQGKNIEVNERAATLLGYTVEELQQLSFRQMVEPSELSSSENVLSKLLAGESPPIYERIFRSKTGEKIPVEVNVQIVRDAYGRPQHIQSIVRDIRQRKSAEQDARNSENQLRSLLAGLPDRAVILDRDGYYRDVLNTIMSNPPIAGIGLVGQQVSSVATPEFAEFCIRMIRKTLDEDTAQSFEYDYPHENQLHHFDARTVPYRDIASGETWVIWVTRDITERKKAAQGLIESEQRLRAFASALPDRAIMLDENGYYRQILKENYEDVPIAIHNLKGKRIHDVLAPDFVEFCMEKLRETLQRNETLAFDYELTLQGETYYLDGRTVPSTDPETGQRCVIWISRDISRLKKAEHALQYHNRLYSLITALAIEFVNLPIDKLDANIHKALEQIGEFIEADRSFINTFSSDLTQRTVAYEWYAPSIAGMLNLQPPQEISKDSWSMQLFLQQQVIVIPSIEKLPEEAQAEKESLQRRGIKSLLSIPLFRKGKLTGTLGFQTLHSEKAWTDSTSDLLRIVGEIYTNALQRKEAEEALIDSEKRLRILIRSMPDRAVIFDRDGRFLEILKEDYESIRMSDELLSIYEGQYLHEFYSPEFTEFCLTKIHETLDLNQSLVFQYPSPMRGDDFQLEARLIPFRDPQTKEERVFWVTRDISERLQAEKHNLELALAREKVDFLRQFVDSITHDLKTPITVIGTSLHLLERSQDAEKRQDRMLVMRKNLGTLSHMVDELLAVARLDEIPQLQFSTQDFYKILQDVVEFLRPKAELKQINLSLNLAEGSPRISAAYDELNRALSNLIDNAIKYTPNNGSVNVTVHFDAGELVFEVQDTGIGMSPDEMERVFERFFRTDRARSEAPGTGLGLEITRRIVELHGGKISLESEVNHGSTFRVFLPQKIDEGNLLELEK
jgi:PAS domain S-box-containing protein